MDFYNWFLLQDLSYGGKKSFFLNRFFNSDFDISGPVRDTSSTRAPGSVHFGWGRDECVLFWLLADNPNLVPVDKASCFCQIEDGTMSLSQKDTTIEINNS